MTARSPVVFLVDVDNTLVDDDHIATDLKRHLRQAEGFAVAMAKMSLDGHIDKVVDTIEGDWRNM